MAVIPYSPATAMFSSVLRLANRTRPGQLRGDRLDDGAHHPAGPAPGGPEIHENGKVRLQDLRRERLLR